MSHTVREKQKLLNRARRIRGQADAIVRALEEEKGCEQVMHLIAGCRGAINGLLAEVVEDHIRTHLVDPDKDPGALNIDAADQLITVVHSYFKWGAYADRDFTLSPLQHNHVFLGTGHDRNAHKTWAVIGLCGVMMAAEIIGGSLFGSLALIADGLHMSTHAGALLLAALAYSYVRHHAEDARFAFGTGRRVSASRRQTKPFAASSGNSGCRAWFWSRSRWH
jgi:DNA-binding FrmR family transcriptional regulator